MAVKLRLRRMGKKRQPIYKIVAADARFPRDGKYLEAIGTYNPKAEPHSVEILEDRALYWLGVGAQPTDTVRSLLRQQGVTHKRELLKSGLTAEQVDAKMSEWSKLKEAAAQSKAKKQAAPAKKKSTAEVKDASSENTASA